MASKVLLTRILRGSLAGRFPNQPGHQLHLFNRYGNILIPPGVSMPPPPPPPPEHTLEGTDWFSWKTILNLWKYLFKLLGGGVIVNGMKYYFLDTKKEAAEEEANSARDVRLENISTGMTKLEEELGKMATELEELKDQLGNISSQATNLEKGLETMTTQAKEFKDEFGTVKYMLGWILAEGIVSLVLVGILCVYPKK